MHLDTFGGLDYFNDLQSNSEGTSDSRVGFNFDLGGGFSSRSFGSTGECSGRFSVSSLDGLFIKIS